MDTIAQFPMTATPIQFDAYPCSGQPNAAKMTHSQVVVFDACGECAACRAVNGRWSATPFVAARVLGVPGATLNGVTRVARAEEEEARKRAYDAIKW